MYLQCQLSVVKYSCMDNLFVTLYDHSVFQITHLGPKKEVHRPLETPTEVTEGV